MHSVAPASAANNLQPSTCARRTHAYMHHTMRLPVTLLLLPTALTAALHSVADTPLHALPAPPRPCPPGYTCFPTASAFARAVNVAGPPGPTSSKLALLCPAATD